MTLLASVPDPRDPRGVRHPLPVLLVPGLAAVLAGARSFVVIGEWVAFQPAQVLAGLGVLGAGPAESTIRRAFARAEPALRGLRGLRAPDEDLRQPRHEHPPRGLRTSTHQLTRGGVVKTTPGIGTIDPAIRRSGRDRDPATRHGRSLTVPPVIAP